MILHLMNSQLAEAQKRLEGRESVFYKRVRDIYINGTTKLS